MTKNAQRRRYLLLPGLDIGELVERFNLRRVYSWLLLAGAVGLVGGLGALAFKWLTDQSVALFWPTLVDFAPATAGGEPSQLVVHGSVRVWGLIVAPALGGLLSALLVYRFAPEAAGHGTDAAIRSYHREGGRIRWLTPIIKLLASALTLGSGGSAGREGPIAQIGAGFGSVLGTALHLSERERRVLLMAGVSAGIGAIFRAPFAGAIFAAEVLYREADLEPEVLVPALVASIVSYSVYCSVHGFGHLLTGTTSFTFDRPLSLACYAVLGLVVSFGGIAYARLMSFSQRVFAGLPITNYAKPPIGGLIVGILAASAYLVAHDPSVLGVMGSGYGVLQQVVSERGALGPPLEILAFVAIAKMLTTSLTIGSGGSGGVFGPSMVIGGCLGAAVGTVFHHWAPNLVPDVGPFTIVGMAGFFAGVAKTPISTLLMVGELTGNYELLLPSMLVVCFAMLLVHRWTIYTEQVPTRADSPAHRNELVRDVLADLPVGAVIDPAVRLAAVEPSVSLRDALKLADDHLQRSVPVIDRAGVLRGLLSVDVMRSVVAEDPARGLVIAQDLIDGDVPLLSRDVPVPRALELLAAANVDALAVVDPGGGLLGVLDRRAILGAYRRKLDEASGTIPAPTSIDT